MDSTCTEDIRRLYRELALGKEHYSRHIDLYRETG